MSNPSQLHRFFKVRVVQVLPDTFPEFILDAIDDLLPDYDRVVDIDKMVALVFHADYKKLIR